MNIVDYIQNYIDFLKYDPSFGNTFLGLIISILTLGVATVALRQINEMKKQNKYAADINKIDALKRFTDILKLEDDFIFELKNKYKVESLEIELVDYTLTELIKKEDQDKLKKWEEILISDIEMLKKATDIANNLELFCVSLEDKDIFDSIIDMIATSFCELVERNPAIYIINRNNEGSSVHKIFRRTINFRNKFIPLVGSIQERKNLLNKNTEKYRKLFQEIHA